MKKKWKTLESNIEGFDNEREQLKEKVARLQEESDKHAQAVIEGRASGEEEATRLALMESQAALARVSKQQADVETELNRLRQDTEQHMSEAHMSTTKLQAMRTMLKGVDAVGSANPFRSAGTGQYNNDGAKTGFAMRGRTGSNIGKKG